MLVTPEANNIMSGESPSSANSSYWKKFDPGTKKTLLLDDVNFDDEPEKILHDRFDKFEESVKGTIYALLSQAEQSFHTNSKP
jgi:hypothetical protein